LDADSKLADDRYMTFYNQPITPCGAVQFKCPANNTATFHVDLEKLPVSIERLVIAASIDGDGTMSQLTSGSLALGQSNVKVATFAFSGNDFSAEKALMLMEVYRKEGHWRVWAQGQGFNGGLDALVRYFGGIVTEEPFPNPPPPAIGQLPTPTPQSFFQRVLKPLFTSNGATNVPNDSGLSQHWKRQGVPIKVANVTIDAGLLYFGSGLSSIGSRSTLEPALINPNLPIDKLASANYQQHLLSYWSSYSEISPEARAAYLKWLLQGRNDPLADIGYVFLYFYGLERRALIDATTDPIAKAELPHIVQEAGRLLEIYHNNASFRGYATEFLKYLKADCPETFAPQQYLAPPPDFKPTNWSLPFTLKLVLGQLAMDNEPVPARWAYVWLMADPTIRHRTPAHRCASEFKQLFIEKYGEVFCKGMRLPVNKTKIKISYHTASPSFSYRTLERKLDIPDVTVLTSRIKKLQTLADGCSDTLNAYSRFLGRNPGLAGTLDALLELPYTLWTEGQKKQLQTIKQTLETTQTPIGLQFAKLKAWLPEWQTLTKPRVLSFINRLAEAGLGIEPDPRFGSGIPHDDSKVILFLDDGSNVSPSPRYSTAALTLHLAVMLSMADGDVGMTERDLLIRQIEEWLHLEAAEKNRLHAHLRWLLSGKPELKSVKKRVETLPLPAREALAHFLVLVAKADNIISANEVKILEKIYKLLTLDVQSLYGKLHGTGTDEPITVRPAASNSGGFTIPPPPETPTGVQLDMSRVAALKEESKKVTDMLVAIFEQDAATEILAAPPDRKSVV
jgi:stress response protein SCP2/tellurite resistance protein